MTPKEKRFCDEYLVDFNAGAASTRAGYSAKNADQNGYNVLKRPAVQKCIKAKIEKKDKKLVASQDEILSFLTAVMRGEEKDEKVISDGLGRLKLTQVRSQLNQIKCAELLAKINGMFTDKVEFVNKPEIVDDIPKDE